MVALLRYNLKIVLPTMLWTGILVALLVFVILFNTFRSPESFNAPSAGWYAEQLIPLIAAFFAAGVMDAEMKRGAHELLRAKRSPLWLTVLLRTGLSLVLALAVGWGMLAALHFGVKRIPLGMLLLASLPPALCLAMIALWTRIRFGNAFIGYMVALAIWLANFAIFLSLSASPLRSFHIQVNPLLTMTSYSDRLFAEADGVLESTPYADWWWVSKIALTVVALLIFLSVTRRVENLVEAD